MRYGSVCSGIEAASVAWEPLGWTPAWFSEIEPFPCAVLAHRFPSVPNLGDMTTIRERVLAGEVEAPDLLVGGTPCQSFSVAGLRRSLSDERGNLALELIRLADAIDAVRVPRGEEPCWILWENVPGVLSTDDNAFGAFLGGLVGGDAPVVAPAGWTGAGVVRGPARVASWRVLDAQHFGVAQRRRRVFVLARGGAGAWSAADALLPLVESVRWHPAPSRAKGAGAPGGAAAGVARSLRASDGRCGGDTGDERGLLVPEVAGCVASKWSKGTGGPSGDECQNLVPVEPIPLLEVNKRQGVEASGKDGTGIGAAGAPMFTLQADAQHGVMAPIAFDTTQITHPENRSRCDPGAPAPALAESGHVPAIAFHAGQDPISGDVSPALGSGGPRGTGYMGVALAAAVRRLTPRECEALQGFPAGWTLIPMSDATRTRVTADFAAYIRRQYAEQGWAPPTDDEVAKLAADGPRYRALGNSMAVPVVRHIGRAIQRVTGGGR